MHTTAGSSPWPLGSGQWGTGTLAGYKYGYDAASRITGMESYWYNSGNDVGVPSSSAYSYDFTSQLTGADHSGLGDEAYSYDANGNRTMAGYSTGLNNLLQSDGTFSYVYDAEGNRIRKREIATGVYWAYTYDHRNRLVTVDEVDPSAAMGNLTGQGAGWGSPSASGETEEPETGWGPTSTYGHTGSSWGSSFISVHAYGEAAQDTFEVRLTGWGTFKIWVESMSADVTQDLNVYCGLSAATPCTMTGFYDYDTGDTGYRQEIPVVDDEWTEGTESFAIHVYPEGYPEDEMVLEGDINDDDGNYQAWSYAAEVSSAVEGSNLVLTAEGSPAAEFEYRVEDVSAQMGVDYTANGITGYWTAVGASGQVVFPTYVTAGYGQTRSLRVVVRIVGVPESEMVLEGDIYDREDGFVQRVEYGYDAFNQLVRRTRDDDGPYRSHQPEVTYYSYQDGQIVLQFDGNAADDLSHRYLWGPAVDQLLADEQLAPAGAGRDEPGDWEGAVLWALADHLGTVRDIAVYDAGEDETTIANHRVYDSFGNLISESAAAVDVVFGFTGRFWDKATNLQWNLWRWYDPLTGKWTGQDPIGFGGGDANLQRYVGNNPVNSVDPSGLVEKSPLEMLGDFLNHPIPRPVPRGTPTHVTSLPFAGDLDEFANGNPDHTTTVGELLLDTGKLMFDMLLTFGPMVPCNSAAKVVAGGRGIGKLTLGSAPAGRVPHVGRGVRNFGEGFAEGLMKAGRRRPPKGGPYIAVRSANKGGHVHHVIADAISPFTRDEGPSILMEIVDHRRTASYGNSRAARAYRDCQKSLIEQGRMREAIQMDIDDIRTKFGTKYDDAIKEMLDLFQ